jgi:hypothetical protein
MHKELPFAVPKRDLNFFLACHDILFHITPHRHSGLIGNSAMLAY